MSVANAEETLPEWIVWRLFGDNVESDTSYGDFMVKVVQRWSGNLIYDVFSIETPDQLYNLYILSLK